MGGRGTCGAPRTRRLGLQGDELVCNPKVHSPSHTFATVYTRIPITLRSSEPRITAH